ncbi:hypothetical protein B9479_005962 [Cryptococcus floricola]|uniref:FIST domain-containing protein n=1 Tax=Cryptococcus floricola TaxID=2591691 RepID=A0A5D3APN6_9TREE|nr:hypothetical protein B9479_005962 [Cryptococcus floricola]
MLPRRLLRTPTRGIHTTAHTFYSPTPPFLRDHLASHPAPPDSTSVFLLSTSLPDLPAHLAAVQGISPQSIGSFCVSPPGSEPTLSLATFWDADITLFKSELSGRAPAEVGRFQRPERQRETRSEDLRGSTQSDVEGTFGQGWESIWKGENSVEKIAGLEGVQADSFLLLSDSRPAPVLGALDSMFPTAAKTGLLTAPTPFITNRPHTLLYNKEILQSGTIGLAINSNPTTKTDFGLSAMVEPVTITSARGNMLLAIDGINSNPTQLLISAIQQRGGTGLTKEEEFFLGFLEGGKVKRVTRIVSGDPGRGAMSLDTEEPLLEGQTVQFMHRSAILFPQPLARSITFTSLPPADQIGDHPIGTPRVSEGFLASSEEGFIYSNPQSWVCTAPGAVTTTSWYKAW